MASSPRRRHDDFSDEVQAHLDLETDRLIADGMSAEDARAAARRAFGNVAVAKERFYEASRWVWLEQLVQDLRYAWRGMRHSPAFVATDGPDAGRRPRAAHGRLHHLQRLRAAAVRGPRSATACIRSSGARKDGGGQEFRWRDYEELSRRTDLFNAVDRRAHARSSRRRAGR